MTWCWRAMTSWVGKCRNQPDTERGETSESASSLVGEVRNPNMSAARLCDGYSDDFAAKGIGLVA
jgi:hypothetical protein